MSKPSTRGLLTALFLTAAVVVVCALYLARPGSGPDSASQGVAPPDRAAAAGMTAAQSTEPSLPSSVPSGAEASAGQRLQQLLATAPQAQGRDAERLFANAIRDPDLSVRLEALQLSASAAAPEVDQAVLPVALQDEDPGLRDRAILRVNELPVARRIEFFAGALSGGNAEMAAKAAEWLGVLGGKSSVEALVKAWPQMAGQARSGAIRRALERLSGRSFASPREAQTWWLETAPTLDEALLPMVR